MAEKTKNKTQKSKIKSSVGTRGRIFQGEVTKVFPKRVVIEFNRFVRVPKYERFMKKSTRIHARIPEGMEIEVGDIVKAGECRPLSKIIHHIVIEKIKSGETQQ